MHIKQYICSHSNKFKYMGYNLLKGKRDIVFGDPNERSMARSIGCVYGSEHHVRVNTISQSPTITAVRYDVRGMDKPLDFACRISSTGNASADECAECCVVMFSGLTEKVTMQHPYHDGGFSSAGMSLRAMATYGRGLDEYKGVKEDIMYG